METLFDLFIQEKTYLCNVSPKTIRFYRQPSMRYRNTGQNLTSSLSVYETS